MSSPAEPQNTCGPTRSGFEMPQTGGPEAVGPPADEWSVHTEVGWQGQGETGQNQPGGGTSGSSE